jgi:hypothetical protein
MVAGPDLFPAGSFSYGSICAGSAATYLEELPPSSYWNVLLVQVKQWWHI